MHDGTKNNATVPERPSPEDAAGLRELYARITRHERGLWVTTIAIVVMSALTISILTAASAVYGAFRGPYLAYLLAGASFLLLGLFLAYVGMQRETLEENRVRIFRRLQTQSAQLQEANRAFQESLRTRDVFLNTVSHELKTPLTCIVGYAEYMEQEELPSPEVKAHAGSVLHEAHNLLRLIEQLVDITRFRSGAVSLERERVDLNALLGQVVASVSRDLGRRISRVETDFLETPLPVRLDVTRIEMVFDALIRNGVARDPEAPPLGIRTACVDGEWAEVLVTTPHERLSAEEQERLFQPFGTLNPSPDGRSGDLGLALPLLKRYVLAHGGLLQVNGNETPTLEFRIQLPLDTEDRVFDPGSPLEAGDAIPLKRAS